MMKKQVTTIVMVLALMLISDFAGAGAKVGAETKTSADTKTNTASSDTTPLTNAQIDSVAKAQAIEYRRKIAKEDSLCRIDSLANGLKKQKERCDTCDTCKKYCTDKDSDLGWIAWFVVFMPVNVLIILAIMVVWLLLKFDYNLGDALKENTLVYTKDGPIFPNSSTRLVLLITSLMAVGFCTCIACFWFYRYITCGMAPDIEGLKDVLIALGIGVTPYAVNRVSSVLETGSTAAANDKKLVNITIDPKSALYTDITKPDAKLVVTLTDNNLAKIDLPAGLLNGEIICRGLVPPTTYKLTVKLNGTDKTITPPVVDANAPQDGKYLVS